jgi:putative copper export protein
MLEVTTTTIRLFLHVLAATVWVGGQLTLAGLVPRLRAFGPDAPRAIARRFAALAWPAYAVLVATGIWNVLAVNVTWDTAYAATLMVKITVAALSGVAAFMHGISRSRAGLAIWGAVGSISAVAALFLGVQLNS